MRLCDGRQPKRMPLEWNLYLYLFTNINFLIMNKKFSTLMASLMLASAFSVSAQTGTPSPVEKYENGKYYMLGGPYNVLAVKSDASEGKNYGELELISKNSEWTLADTRRALWQVTVVEGKAGDAPKYSFVNVATGMTLSVPTPDPDVKDGKIGEGTDPLMISGGYMEWLNGGANSFDLSNPDDFENIKQPFYSYVNSEKVVYLNYGSILEDGRTDLFVKIGTYAQMLQDIKESSSTIGVFQILPYQAHTVDLTADDLNKELITNNDDPTKDSFFKLSFDQDVTEGAENLFAATPLQATVLYQKKDATDGVWTTSKDDAKLDDDDPVLAPYVRLYSKDNGYLMVDTALHTGSEAMTQLPKFTYVANPDAEGDPIKGNNYSRLSNSANFKFAYEPINDRVLIKVEKYAKRVQNWDGTPVLVDGVDGNEAYTYWPTSDYTKKGDKVTDYTNPVQVNKTSMEDPENDAYSLISDAYVRLVTLSNVRELTVAYDKETNVEDSEGANYAEWAGADDLKVGMLTTVKIGEGAKSYVPTTIKSGLYMIQFVKNSANTNAAEGNYYVANLGGAFGYAEQAKNQAYDHMPAAHWYVAQQGSISSAPLKIWNREFFDQDVDMDGDGNVDNYFGDAYQYQAFQGPDGTVFFRGGAFANDTVKYVFNYLHGLAASSEVGLNTPIAKDSLVRVDETGETIAFRLVPVVVDDSYGKQFDEKKQGVANLIRNAYYIQAYDEIKFAEDNEPRYLTYDKKSKKYVMSKTPTAYFLKENNCVGDVHYYALVEAELLTVEYRKINSDVRKTVFYPESFKGLKTTDEKVSDYKTKYASNKPVVTFYDKNGKQIVTDASENVALYAYQENNGKIELQIVKLDGNATKYYYMNAKDPVVGINSVKSNKDGKTVYTLNDNESFFSFSNKNKVLLKFEEDEKIGLKNINGETILSPKYTFISLLIENDGDSRYVVALKDKNNITFKIIDENENEIASLDDLKVSLKEIEKNYESIDSYFSWNINSFNNHLIAQDRYIYDCNGKELLDLTNIDKNAYIIGPDPTVYSLYTDRHEE